MKGNELLDINYKIWSTRFIRIAVISISIFLMTISGTFIGTNEYNQYIEATTKPVEPIVTIEKKDLQAIITIESEEIRDGNEFVIYISEDDKEYKEYLVTKEKSVTVKDLELDKDYYFKANVRIFYKEEQIISKSSKTVSVNIEKPKPVIPETPKAAIMEGFEGYAHEIHSSALPWAPEVERQLRNHGIYTEERKLVILNIIHHESTGREDAVNQYGYTGLMQFGSHWKHDYPESYFIENDIPGPYQADNRLSGNWSIHRIVEVMAEGGDEKVKQHWAQTWNK